MPLVGLLFVNTPGARSQDIGWDNVIESFLSDEDMSSQSREDLLYMYESMHDSPLNINTAQPEDLMALMFLTEGQIEDIQAYIYIHGPMLTLGELQLIGSIDYKTRQMLSQFVYAGTVPPQKESIKLLDVLKYGRSGLVTSLNIPLYMRDGFKSGKYPGSRLSHSVRYSFDWHGRIRFGITADKDAGETFFKRNRMGYDYISPYFFIKDTGLFHELAAGNYRASFGYGLLMNSGFSVGKTMALTSMEGPASGIRPHSSTQEYGYLRGVGGSFRKGHTVVSVLGSYCPQDATLKGDTVISSFKEDGYHRTDLEWSRKHNIRIGTAAMDVRYDYRGLGLGITTLADWLSVPYRDRKRYFGVAADWSLRRPGYSTGGQVAVNDGHLAAIVTHRFRINHSLGVNMVFRHYGKDYYAMRASALSEGGVTNETGLLTGITYCSYSLKTGGYVDLFMHPAPRYGASAPSKGMDMRAETDWNMGKRDELSLTARLKSKQKDCKYTGGLEYLITFRGRVRWTHHLSTGSVVRSQLLFSRYDFIAQPIQNGWACTMEYDRSMFGDCLQASLFAAWFNTDTYNCNIPVYEKGLRYSYGFNTLYGKGWRLATVIRCKPMERLNLGLKLGSTIFLDRDAISSAQQRIDSNHKEDISVQFSHSF